MNLRRTEPDVIDFLRATLAERAHPVTKVEASARAAGLLNEGQRITHAKAFKRAEPDVIDFLRATLAERAHPVTKVEASARAAVKSVPVVRDGRVTGIIARGDLLRVLAANTDL